MQNRSQLEQLQTEIAREVIAPNLDTKDIVNVMCTSKTLNAMFAPVSGVAKFLNLVYEADYPAVEKMLEDNIKLIFNYVSIKNKNVNGIYEYETISPLQLAFKNLDTYMWKMFLEKIVGCKKIHIFKDMPDDLQLYKNSHILASGKIYSVNADGKAEIAKIKNPELLKQFMKQLKEQNEHINLDSLFSEYETYVGQYNRSLSTQISEEDMNKAWFNLGKKQRDVLPRHMLKEFCRKGNSWSVKSKFDVTIDQPPAGAEITNYITGCQESILPMSSNSDLGFNVALMRGSRMYEVFGWAHGLPKFGWMSSAVPSDSSVFRRLYEVRNGDFVTLRSQLDLLPENDKNSSLVANK